IELSLNSSPHLRQASKRSEEIPSGFPRYGSGLHTSSTALRDYPRTWVSRKRETCVKPRAVSGKLSRNQLNMKEDKQDLITKSITDKKDAKNILFKLWNDSVISQIIASGLLILIPIFTAFIVKLLDYKNIKTLFQDFLRLEVKL